MSKPKNKTSAALLLLVSLLSWAGLSYSEGQRSRYPKFSLKLTGGGRYSAIGDMNKHLDSINHLPNVTGNIEKVNNWSGDLQVELRIGISQKFGLGFVTSPFFQRSNQSSLFIYGGEMLIPEIPKIDEQLIFAPKIKAAMPLGLNLYYSAYSSSKFNILIHSGIEWHTGKITENQTYYLFYSTGETYYGNRYWSVENKFCLGFQGGLGLEYSITDDLALVMEMQGRYVRMSNFKGTMKSVNNSYQYEESGTLYYFRTTRGETGPWYTELEVRERQPDIGILPIKDAREAILNLSGFSLRIGVRIRLL